MKFIPLMLLSSKKLRDLCRCGAVAISAFIYFFPSSPTGLLAADWFSWEGGDDDSECGGAGKVVSGADDVLAAAARLCRDASTCSRGLLLTSTMLPPQRVLSPLDEKAEAEALVMLASVEGFRRSICDPLPRGPPKCGRLPSVFSEVVRQTLVPPTLVYCPGRGLGTPLSSLKVEAAPPGSD